MRYYFIIAKTLSYLVSQWVFIIFELQLHLILIWKTNIYIYILGIYFFKFKQYNCYIIIIIINQAIILSKIGKLKNRFIRTMYCISNSKKNNTHMARPPLCQAFATASPFNESNALHFNSPSQGRRSCYRLTAFKTFI